jgi:glucokinase
MNYILGVDIGGTKIATAILNDEGSILSRSEIPSDTTNQEAMFKQVTKAIRLVVNDMNLSIEDLDGIGIGVPGKVNQEEGIAVLQNNLPWKNFPIVSRLREIFPVDNILVDNDVHMATLAEWNLYGAYSTETFVYCTISTGVSSAIIHKGEFIRGMGFAGEIGFLPVETSKGNTRLEHVASGPGIERLTNHRLTSRKVFENYLAQDEEAHKIIHEIVNSLARASYAIGCILDPGKIVFGGGVINQNPFLLELIKNRMEEYCIPEQREMIHRMYTSKSKGDAGVLGAGLSIILQSKNHLLLN